MKRKTRSNWRTMTRFDQCALAIAGTAVVGLYVLVAADLLGAAPGAGEPVQANKRSIEPVSALSPDRFSPPDPPIAPVRVEKPRQVHAVGATDKVRTLFRHIRYDLESVREHGEVPRIFFTTVPEDLHRIRQPGERKKVFLRLVLPLILHVNELILHDRNRITALRARVRGGERLHIDQKAWLAGIMEAYGMKKLDFDELLRRVDIIPPSLALAQSAEESGWGTSRFAREGNALFGQRTWRGKRGIVPKKRAEGARYRVRTFDHLIDGVKSYAHNLNTHFAYDAFRAARAEMRAADDHLDGSVLAGTLRRYSERGDAYVATIRTIIRVNGLGVFDRARLRDQLVARDSIPGA